MKSNFAEPEQADVQLVCLKFLQTTETLLQQADRLRQQRDQFLKTLTSNVATDAPTEEVASHA